MCEVVPGYHADPSGAPQGGRHCYDSEVELRTSPGPWKWADGGEDVRIVEDQPRSPPCFWLEAQ